MSNLGTTLEESLHKMIILGACLVPVHPRCVKTAVNKTTKVPVLMELIVSSTDIRQQANKQMSRIL